MLCERREEYRDLKRISDENGMPPQGAMPGDPTGSTAVKLVDSLENVQREIDKTFQSLEDINAYIESAHGETDKFILVLKFIRGRQNDEIVSIVENKTGKVITAPSLKKRLGRIIRNLPEHK